MFSVLTCLTVEHNWRLVVLAGAVCLLASLVAISLFRRAMATRGRMRVTWLALAGAADGCGIWATHFIAMLAYEPGIPIAYDVLLTSLSLALAVLVTGGGLSVAVYAPKGWGPLLGGAVVGGGIASMHYTGMWALELPGRITWHPGLVLTSIVLGILLASAAVGLAVRRDDVRHTFAAAGLLALAILSHHFAAMGAVEIVPDPARTIQSFSMPPGALAIAVASAALAILTMSFASAFADRRMRERDAQLRTAMDNMSSGLIMFDANERLVVCNEQYIEMYGLPAQAVKPGVSLLDIVRLRNKSGTLAHDPEEYREALLEALAKKKTTSSVLEAPDGRIITVRSRPLADGAWVATHEDITERRRSEERIAHLAHHDALTGLPNRAAFSAQLVNVFERAAVSNEKFALLSFDLDRFKEINDVFGHGAGDGLLRELSRRILAVIGNAYFARLGGDEFMIILTDDRQPGSAADLAERLSSVVAEDIIFDGHHLRIGLSIGVALFPNDGRDVTSLLSNVDAALYRAKADGRGTIRFFEADMDQNLRESRLLQHDLRSAIPKNELALHYQPQARVDGAVVGFEALIRWNHPIRGLIKPNIFIPIAENSGLIIAIGEWVMRQACCEAATWQKPLQIAVNLSPVQFKHGDLPAMIHAILLETGLAAKRLELEITEGVLIEDFPRAISILRRLKALGVRIAMDDFGTGYSSLSYLQAFPFDKIKIDQTFIANLDRNEQSATIVRSVIGLAHGLGLPVVAEGVETAEQLEFLTNALCNKIQGFFIGRPRPMAYYADVVQRAEVGQIEMAGETLGSVSTG